MLNFYLKHTTRIRMLVERMFGIINLGVSVAGLLDWIESFRLQITNYPGVNATAEQMWADVQASIPSDVTHLLNFAKDVRVLIELNDYVVITDRFEDVSRDLC